MRWFKVNSDFLYRRGEYYNNFLCDGVAYSSIQLLNEMGFSTIFHCSGSVLDHNNGFSRKEKKYFRNRKIQCYKKLLFSSGPKKKKTLNKKIYKDLRKDLSEKNKSLRGKGYICFPRKTNYLFKLFNKIGWKIRENALEGDGFAVYTGIKNPYEVHKDWIKLENTLKNGNKS